MFACPQRRWLEDRRLKCFDLSNFVHFYEFAEADVDKLIVLLLVEEGIFASHEDARNYRVLDKTSEGLSTCGHAVLLVSGHQTVCFCDRLVALRQVNVHLIAVKISVVGVAVGVVHSDCLLLWQYATSMSHDTGLVQGGLPIHKQWIVVREVAVYDFSTDIQKLGGAISLFWGHVRKMNNLACLLILDHVGTRVNCGTVSHGLPESLGIETSYRFWVRELLGHEYWNSDLVSSNIRVWRNNTPTTVVDSLAHHLHPEHTFLFLKQLSDAALLFVGILGSHRGVHEAVYSFLELNPLLSSNTKFSRLLSLPRLVQERVLHRLVTGHNLQKHRRVSMQVGLTLASSSATTVTSLALWPEPRRWHDNLIEEEHLQSQGMHLKWPIALVFGLKFTVHQV